MSNNKELSELLNNNFNKYKEDKKKQILAEQQELINKYNNEIIPYNDLNIITVDNFYTNYFNNINNIVIDLLHSKKWIKDGRLFYLGITFIFISFIYFLICMFKRYNKILK
jgi:hypothetical protein